MAARTRRETLKDLAENYVSTQNEGPARIASRIFFEKDFLALVEIELFLVMLKVS